MRKVKNKKAVKRLALKSFKANRTRNTIAVAAIVLTAVLFTAIFTIGIGIIIQTERSSMLQAGGDAHGAIKDVTQDEYDILKKHPLIKECGRDIVVAHSVNNKEFLKRHVEMHYIDKEFYPHWFIDIIGGKAPEAADEILMDEKSLQLLGIKPEAGSKVTLEIQVLQQMNYGGNWASGIRKKRYLEFMRYRPGKQLAKWLSAPATKLAKTF